MDRVVITEDSITRIRADGIQESVRWDDLSEVGLVTTDEGPFADDVFWLLLSSDRKSGCAVPQGIEGEKDLFSRLQSLPGFDNSAVIKAMSSTSNASFVCWKKSQA